MEMISAEEIRKYQQEKLALEEKQKVQETIPHINTDHLSKRLDEMKNKILL